MSHDEISSLDMGYLSPDGILYFLAVIRRCSRHGIPDTWYQVSHSPRWRIRFSLFLSLLPLLVLPSLALLVFSFLSFPFSFFAFLSSLSFFLSSFLFLCFFFPIDLRLSCVCVVIGTTCNIYAVVFLGWQAV